MGNPTTPPTLASARWPSGQREDLGPGRFSMETMSVWPEADPHQRTWGVGVTSREHACVERGSPSARESFGRSRRRFGRAPIRVRSEWRVGFLLPSGSGGESAASDTESSRARHLRVAWRGGRGHSNQPALAFSEAEHRRRTSTPSGAAKCDALETGHSRVQRTSTEALLREHLRRPSGPSGRAETRTRFVFRDGS